MKELVFLPDREGRDELASVSGFVRVGADGASLRSLSDRLVLPPRKEKKFDVQMWRGVLTLALLCDAWTDADATVAALAVDSTTSRFAAWAISARPADQRRDALHLILLKKGEQQVLLGIADAHAGLTLPATPTDFADIIPARAAWYDAENKAWADPVPCLNEHERAILLARLTMMGLDAPEAAALKADLADAGKAAVEAAQSEEESALHALGIRIQAVCALKDFAAFTHRREPCAVTADNPLVRVYSAVDVRYEADRECSTYLWNGVPFARTSAALGLTGVEHPDQAETLAAIEGELQLLTEHSVRWNNRCADGITDWLREQDEALLPQVRAQAEAIRHVQMQKGREIQGTITLEWPWDASSGAVRYLLRESLGDGWMRGAANPFSDYLTKLTGHALGDHALQNGCACADGVLLPPLSREMALCAASALDGEGLAPDMMRFEPREDGGITASFLLRGVGEIRMVRVYPVEDILVLDEADSPSVAVWPCVPMEHWRAYHVFVKGGAAQVAALSGGTWKSLEAADSTFWRSLQTETYPACLCLTKDGKCLGALPNALPRCQISMKGDAVATIDMGASAVATVIRMDGKAVSANGDELTRVLVSPQDAPADDFLAGLTPAEITPASVMLTGAGDDLFADGYVYAVNRVEEIEKLEPGSVCTALKWRADEKSVRARRILLHQVMLGASLNAMMAGAGSIRWRVTVADEMADEGRNALFNLVDELSIIVAQETGLLLKDGKFTVIWAEEAAAIHNYLKGPGGMKGTFAVLDVGGSSVKLHLWMQGKNKPLGGAVIMEGASTLLMRTMADHPDWFYEDFADCGNEELLDRVCSVCTQLNDAGESAAQADKALMMLDALLETYKEPITRHLYARFNAQRPTYAQSILLEAYGAALFCVGLMLEQAGSDSSISHLFPADLEICLTGRGAWLLDTLTPQLRHGLQRVAHAPMQLRHPVRSLTVRPASMPALGTALGMATLKETQRTNDTPVIRTRQSFSELMRLMMEQLFQCYPLHVWTLHPGLFDQWNNLTPAGEETIRQVASACYGEGEDIPASVMAFAGKLQRTAVTQPLPMTDDYV